MKSTYSQLLSNTNCHECEYSTHNHDPIQIITLHMKPHFKTIYDLLSDYTDLEVLDSDNQLITAKNILLTPHLGASTIEAKEGVTFSICNQIRYTYYF